MKRVILDRQQAVGDWISAQFGWKPFHADCATAIGIESDGEIVGGFLFEDYRGQSVQIHLVGVGNWLTRELSEAVHRYVFDELKVTKAMAILDLNNTAIVKLCEHIGFVRESVIKDAGRSGDMAIYTITRQQCRHPVRK